MVAVNFPISLSFTIGPWPGAPLGQEGGFSDDAHDPGGATMRGIELTEFQEWYGSDKTVADLKAITMDQLTEIYQESYWNQGYCNDLPAGVDLSVFDFGVNAGPVEAIKVLQRELAVAADGVIGPITMAAVVRQNPAELVLWLQTGQLRFYRSLSTFRYFGTDWTNRTNARYLAAMGLLVPPTNKMAKARR